MTEYTTRRYLPRMIFKVDITYKALASFTTYLTYVSFGQKLSELRLATIASQTEALKSGEDVNTCRKEVRCITLLLYNENDLSVSHGKLKRDVP